jgi:hypothetical protein
MCRFTVILVGNLTLFTAGCASSHRSLPHDSWSKPVKAKALEFEGVYRNHSLDSQTGKAAENGNELVVFLLGPTHASSGAGERLEIRAAKNGQQLKLRLLNEQGSQIDSGTLQRGSDFDFADGRLIVHGPDSGLRSLNSNFGPGLTVRRYRLHLTASGDLLASNSQSSAMLGMILIPGASTMEFWMFWPKLAK